MSASFDGIPSDIVEFEIDRGAVSLRVDEALYPLEAIYAAAYVFIDRCYVFLDRPGEQRVRVTLSSKKGPFDADAARDVVGEFANELISCAWRAQIAKESRVTIEAVTAQALAGARGAPSLDELEAFDFSDEAFDDPLGIAMSWEEKYAKGKKDAPKVTAQDAAKAPDAPAEEGSK
jgi:His-Xaa-Ser system protein HxsD